jgi:hypothetical protein
MLEYEFLANCGLMWEQTLRTLAFMLGTLGFLVGLFLGWLVTECRDGITWRAYTPWPKTKTKPPMWFDGKKWRVIESPKKGASTQFFWEDVVNTDDKGKYKVYTMVDDKNVDDTLHPVRFTRKQFGLIDHIMGHFSEHFEEESKEFFATMDKYRTEE